MAASPLRAASAGAACVPPWASVAGWAPVWVSVWAGAPNGAAASASARAARVALDVMGGSSGRVVRGPRDVDLASPPPYIADVVRGGPAVGFAALLGKAARTGKTAPTHDPVRAGRGGGMGPPDRPPRSMHAGYRDAREEGVRDAERPQGEGGAPPGRADQRAGGGGEGARRRGHPGPDRCAQGPRRGGREPRRPPPRGLRQLPRGGAAARSDCAPSTCSSRAASSSTRATSPR